jgi:hypothetical protein
MLDRAERGRLTETAAWATEEHATATPASIGQIKKPQWPKWV